MKKTLLTVLVLISVLSLFIGCGSKKETAGTAKEETKVYTLKMSTVLPESDQLPIHMQKLADSLLARSNGRLKIEVLAAGVLGDTVQVLEQAKSGMNVAVILDAGRFADYVPAMNIFEAHYNFNNYEEALKFTQSDMFKGWVKEAEQYGIHVSSWNWFQGARHYWTQKEMKSIADFKNLKIRTGSSPMWQEIIKAFGATPVAIAGNEVYSALQQKVVDGMDAQITTSGNYEEVLSYITKTNQFLLLSGIVVGQGWYSSLPADLQMMLDEEVAKFGTEYSNYMLNNLASMEAELIKRGFTINDFDLDAAKKATDVVYDKFPGFRDLKTQIRTIVEK